MVNVEEYVDISSYCTLQIGGQFRYFSVVEKPTDLPQLCAMAQKYGKKIFILGSGSNIVFPDGVLDLFVIKMDIKGFEIINETDTAGDIKIGAGENWDSVVERSVAMNLSGIEAMSAIPGTAGATPVQNVGAYGQEIKDTLVSVEVYEIESGEFMTLSNADCQFSYRNSIFKGETRGTYIITSLVLRLKKEKPSIPNYPGVKKYFIENRINNPTIQELREAIIDIRSNKLPDPKDIPSVGSFFKNTIVPKDKAKELKNQYPDIILFPLNENETKVPAGFLIENAGLKGKNFGTISSYANNAMVLVNNGGATRADVERVRDEIIQIVFQKFGIALETEPEFV